MIVKTFKASGEFIFRRTVTLAFILLATAFLVPAARAQSVTQPMVAIHDSELTRALTNMPASGATPTGYPDTGFQWWEPDWNYYIMPDSLKEAFTSDGTAFTVIGDSNVSSGLLLTNGMPKYPIIFSLASAAIRNDEIAQFTNYVAAGGFLYIAGPAFTRDTNGNSLGDFAFANQMGVHMVVHGLQNYGSDSTITRQFAHPLVAHLPDGQLTWRLPAWCGETNWGISPDHTYTNSHDIWQVTASDATVVAQGDQYPYITVKPYGKGYFIYETSFNPILANGGFGPGMYAYKILRNAVEWAFTTQNMPVPKLSPWPYQYDAAFIMRHDLEDYANEMADILPSAQIEASNNVHGDYYLCTGTVRVDMQGLGYNTNLVVQNMRTAMTSYGATISSHNGGLKNANNNGLASTNYDYWHWGPDEAIGTSPPGYPNGTAYATASLSNSLNDIETWLSGLMKPSMRLWVSCNFNASREESYNLESQLNFKILGDQKISPFPHWTLSVGTPDKKYAMLSEPVSEWFVNGALAQSLEPWHPPGIQTNSSLHTSIDFYYNLGTLVNFYSHTLTTGEGDAQGLTPDCMLYSLNTNRHPRLWNTNAIGLYQWWLTRSNVQVTVSYTTNSLQSSLTYSIKGATDPNTAIEMLIPGGLGMCNFTVTTNGVVAGTNAYRMVNPQLIRVKVGATVTNVVITYYLGGLGAMVFSENFDEVTAPNLPTGWSASATGAETAWVTSTATNDSAPNSVSVPDAIHAGTSTLVSPSIVLPSGVSQLSFRNNYNLEPGVGMAGYDGGVLEIKIGSGAFTDIITAGGSFVSGAYTGSMDTNTGNTLGDRPGWSGTSHGFISSIINLPPASANQTVQFRWICSTDSSNGVGNFTGWQIDTIAVTNLTCSICGGGTNIPVLSQPSDQTVNEQTTLTVTNTASDPDPQAVLTYTLTAGPTNAQINANGVITWTPTEAQGPSTNTITTLVTTCSGQSASNSFKVFVNEINTPPIFPSPGAQTVNELTTLIVTNSATDTDIPTNSLTYQLISPPNNMTINTNTGVITFTPDESQGPGTYTITTVVTDYNPWAVNSQHLSTTNTFVVTVNEVNTPPFFVGLTQTNYTVNEGVLLTVTDAAQDNDIPANPLTYTLVNPPTGASINSTNGVFTWIPSGLQGPSTNIIEAVVTDFNQYAVNSQHMSATNFFQVIVNDTESCQYTSIFQQNFDGTTAPALPSGWTTSSSGVESNWATTTVSNNTAPNAAFAPDVGNIGTSLLVSPSITMPSGPSILTFKNNFNLENNTSNTNDGYDGGVLEIKIGNGAFTDIITAGGSFLTGGYNATIDTNYQNSLAGRPAWSGNSRGFITTSVSLPSSAASTNIQLRWNCGTDNGNNFVGWWVDTISISNLVCTSGPQLSILPSPVTIGEFSTLRVTNTATEAGSPPPTFTYQLISPPTNASIDTNGIITWSPQQSQSPGTYTITTLVTDNSQPTNLTTSNSFQVIVNEVNVAPVLPTLGAQNIGESLPLSVNYAATETNIHATISGYTILSPLNGMLISPAGLFTWTPSQQQSPGSYTVTVVVSNSDTLDTVNPILYSTNSFTVNVKEVNIAPVPASISQQTVNELITLTVTNTATEPNIHATTTGWGLIGGLQGMNLTVGGLFTWAPSQQQSPGTYTITTVVTNSDPLDTVNPVLTTTNTFSVVVKEVNTAPTPANIGPQTINELLQLTVNAAATESNIHATITGYGLVNPLAGMNVTSAGLFTWTPQQGQSPTNVTVTIVVTNNDPYDTVNPTLTATSSFTVAVKEVNVAPTPAIISPQTVNEQVQLTVNAAATETNIHAAITGYGLVNPLAGMNVTSAGLFTWKPGQDQSPTNVTVTIVVTNSDPYDTVNPTLTATSSFTVAVKEVNIAPVPANVEPQTINEQVQLTVNAAATEPNIHATTTGYGFINPLPGMSVTSAGLFTWKPGQDQSPTNVTVTIVVTNSDPYDTVNPTLTATSSFTVAVKEVNIAPVLPNITLQTVTVSNTLVVNNAATEPNIHATTVGYGLTSAPNGMTISSNGVITWVPDAGQVGTTNLVTTVVTNNDPFDTVNPQLTAINSFQVVVNGIHNGPSLSQKSGVTIDTITTLTVTNTATDNDIPFTGLTYQLTNSPSGATIDSNGVITWSPTTNQTGTSTITTLVTDGASSPLSAMNSFNVTVNAVTPPTILSITVTNAVSTITWSGTMGHTYRLLFMNIGGTNWTEVPVDITLTNGTTGVTTNSCGASPTQEYRISDQHITVGQ